MHVWEEEQKKKVLFLFFNSFEGRAARFFKKRKVVIWIFSTTEMDLSDETEKVPNLYK